MKTAAAFCLFFAAIGMAENGPAVQVKRVASVTWDAQTGKLSWVVQTSADGSADFSKSSEDHYEISPKDAVMAFQGESREFTKEEATWLENVVHILTGYCVASTIWWNHGDVVDPPDSQPGTPQPETPHSKPTNTPDNHPTRVAAPAVETPIQQAAKSEHP
jgi:hypothetical protein